MALSTRTWTELVQLVEASLGHPMDANELIYAKSLANLAASRAYRSHRFWERFLIAGEPRTLIRGYVEFSEDSFHVYGAGTDAANGLYKLNGTANGKSRYSKYQSDGTSVDWDIEWDGATDWELLVGADNGTYTPDVVYYSITDSASLPPSSGWSASNGDSPAPLFVDVAEIDTFYDINVDGFMIAGNGGWSADRLVSSRGCYVELGNSEANEVYVTYKAALTDTYGDGTGGTKSSIPDEWFDYIALYTARHMQIASRQNNDSPFAVIASREVEDALVDQHMKIEHQGIIDNLGRKIETGILNSTMLT